MKSSNNDKLLDDEDGDKDGDEHGDDRLLDDEDGDKDEDEHGDDKLLYVGDNCSSGSDNGEGEFSFDIDLLWNGDTEQFSDELLPIRDCDPLSDEIDDVFIVYRTHHVIFLQPIYSNFYVYLYAYNIDILIIISCS